LIKLDYLKEEQALIPTLKDEDVRKIVAWTPCSVSHCRGERQRDVDAELVLVAGWGGGADSGPIA